MQRSKRGDIPDNGRGWGGRQGDPLIRDLCANSRWAGTGEVLAVCCGGESERWGMLTSFTSPCNYDPCTEQVEITLL